jgi:hypothetical protein
MQTTNRLPTVVWGSGLASTLVGFTGSLPTATTNHPESCPAMTGGGCLRVRMEGTISQSIAQHDGRCHNLKYWHHFVDRAKYAVLMHAQHDCIICGDPEATE